MTPIEALQAVEAVGVVLRVDGNQLRGTGTAALSPQLRATIAEHRPRILAALRLRVLGRAMGLSEEDVRFVEHAVLSGALSEVRIVVPGPKGVL